jgi:CelD/BcsL family acetyltransferase involved in cellulose biosynthesis
MTAPVSVDTEPACPDPEPVASTRTSSRSQPLIVEQCGFDALDQATWDRLASANPWSTPFSRWAFHRAWWDAYADNAHDQTLIVRDLAAPTGDPIAIVPLMHRHEVEPGDAAVHTTMRHGAGPALTPVAPTAKAVFFGASYHADYATILAAPADLPTVSGAVADHLADPSRDPSHPLPWDVVDLRRLRCGDPAADALAEAFSSRAEAHGWLVDVEREDVCPVAILPQGGTFDDFLATLSKKGRHEIRRKIRRAESIGDVRLTPSAHPLQDLEAFIDLHQRKWGDAGLFPPTEGGRQSRVFIRRLFEEFGDDGPVRLAFLTVGEQRIAAGITFEAGDELLYYNAGVDPDARDLSPGVVMVAKYVEHALERGMRRLDFLRGDEPYKYEWGAEDEPIQRLLVRRIES